MASLGESADDVERAEQERLHARDRRRAKIGLFVVLGVLWTVFYVIPMARGDRGAEGCGTLYELHRCDGATP